ncbi:unnamed protein product, partial [Didymodactylos carnosus]
PPPTQLNLPNPSDYYAQLNKCLKLYQLYSRENTIKQQNLSAIRYNKNRKDQHYNIGDYVLTRIQGNRLKLDPRFHPTPMIIIKEKHPTYIVKDPETNETTQIHVNDLRPILEVNLTN